MLFLKKKKSWLSVNLLPVSPTALFSISSMKFFLPVTTFLNCHRFKLLWRENQVWADSFLFFTFHCSFWAISTMYSPLLSCAHYPGYPQINSYNRLTLLPHHTPLPDLEDSSPSFQRSSPLSYHFTIETILCQRRQGRQWQQQNIFTEHGTLYQTSEISTSDW